MKNPTTPIAEKLCQLIIAILILISILLVSCIKNEEVPGYVSLSITNTSPTLGTYNIYLDGIQSNTSGAIPFAGVQGYSELTSGSHTLKFTTASSTDALVNKTIILEENGIYSVFLIDKGENLDLLLLKDEMSEVNKEKAFIRFINLSPDSQTLDLSIAEGATLISDKMYKSDSPFQPIDPNIYNFNINDHGTGAVKATLVNQTLTAGMYYTIISRGMMTPSDIDQPFGVQLISNP